MLLLLVLLCAPVFAALCAATPQGEPLMEWVIAQHPLSTTAMAAMLPEEEGG